MNYMNGNVEIIIATKTYVIHLSSRIMNVAL
jgi:hypothetical protein